MICECCGQEYKFLFPVLSRKGGFTTDHDYICSECAELVNDEYHCGIFRSLVSFASLIADSVEDVHFNGLLVA